MDTNYRILVRNLSGKIITFSVDEYKIYDGLIEFHDKITDSVQRFAVANCEIKENRRGDPQ